MNKPSDEDQIYFYKNFERLLTGNKSDMDWSITTDFKVFSEYLVKDIREIQERLKNADNEYLYYVCEHIFNILDWIKLIVEDAGFPTFTSAWEKVFDEEFADKHILQRIYNDSFKKWILDKAGQHKIGANYYNVINKRLYYRNYSGQWFEVDKKTAFDLKPTQKIISNGKLIKQLNGEYKETGYDVIIKQWEKREYRGMLPDDFLQFSKNKTTPDEYFDFSMEQIKTLLKTPVSIAELERWKGSKITDLEHAVKIATFVLETANIRRNENSHTLYLLRDCLLFNEAQKLIDILEDKNTSCDQILIGRKLLSHKPGHWGYYAVTLDALYNAHLYNSRNFTEFYNEYARLLDLFVANNAKFAKVISGLADYIEEHVQTNKNKVVVFDIGFQGSISLLTKYIIDRHINTKRRYNKVETDIRIGIGAQWSKKLFGHRFDGDYFPMLNRVQLMTRSNELYHFIDGSLKSGELKVEMGDKDTQSKAAIELAVLVMVALIMRPEQ